MVVKFGLTTVLNKQPLFVQPAVKPGLTTVLDEQRFIQHGCQTRLYYQTGLYNRFDSRLNEQWLFVQPEIYDQQVVSCKRGFTVLMLFLMTNQQCQCTEGNAMLYK